MNQYEAKERMTKLAHRLKLWSREYYRTDLPSVSDDVYNAAFAELQQLETQYPDFIDPESPTQRVGETPTSGLPVGKHHFPMLSICTHKSRTSGVGEDFHQTVAKILGKDAQSLEMEYCAEPKYDGLAVELVYFQNKLVQVLTRGDGVLGESILHNAVHVQNVVKEFQVPYEPPVVTDDDSESHVEFVRGEIFFPRWAFAQYKEEVSQEGGKEPSNERNSAAGLMRRIETSKHVSKLKFYPYEFRSTAKVLPIDGQYETLEFLEKLGFSIPWAYIQKVTWEQLDDYYRRMSFSRETLEMPIDGVVYKVNSLALQERLGWNHREPRWAVAHKFEPATGLAMIMTLEITVGRFGDLTPVAIFKDPAIVEGVEIECVNLHNFAKVLEKKAFPGNIATVERAGDTIPHIQKCEDNNPPPFTPPTHCPSCGTVLIHSPDYVSMKCPNTSMCPEQNIARLCHFVSRRALNAKGFGEKVIRDLYKYHGYGEPMLWSNLVEITESELQQALPETYTEVQIHKLWGSLQKAIKELTFGRLLYALSIENLGEASAKSLAAFGPSIMSMSVEQLLGLRVIGETTAKAVYEFFVNPINFVDTINLLDTIKILNKPYPTF